MIDIPAKHIWSIIASICLFCYSVPDTWAALRADRMQGVTRSSVLLGLIAAFSLFMTNYHFQNYAVMCSDAFNFFSHLIQLYCRQRKCVPGKIILDF